MLSIFVLIFALAKNICKYKYLISIHYKNEASKTKEIFRTALS